VKIKLFPVWALNYGSHFGILVELISTMKEEMVCKTFSPLDNKHGVVVAIMAITPSHIKGVKLGERGIAHPWNAEVNVLAGSRPPGFRQPDVNMDGVRERNITFARPLVCYFPYFCPTESRAIPCIAV